ncbi:hypothetical protein [Salmonella enterica]|uniref:hypothetical protein n=1 Tax=Salmonella enterica TaxID=28901 RepID=UPI003D311A79
MNSKTSVLLVKDVSGKQRLAIGCVDQLASGVCEPQIFITPDPDNRHDGTGGVEYCCSPENWKGPTWTEGWNAYFSDNLKSMWATFTEKQQLELSRVFLEIADDLHDRALNAAG